MVDPLPMPTIVTLPGDGIGPEVLTAALTVLNAVADDLSCDEQLFGGASIDAHGTALTDDTLAACRSADAVLLATGAHPESQTRATEFNKAHEIGHSDAG